MNSGTLLVVHLDLLGLIRGAAVGSEDSPVW
jgi:hypothetical protein